MSLFFSSHIICEGLLTEYVGPIPSLLLSAQTAGLWVMFSCLIVSWKTLRVKLRYHKTVASCLFNRKMVYHSV